MDDLTSSPINQAHVLVRKGTSLVDKGDFTEAIEVFKQANEFLTVALEKRVDEPNLAKMINLLLIENDWKIHVAKLRMRQVEDDAADESSPDEVEQKTRTASMPMAEDRDDDDVVVVDHISQFLTDSLNPNRTLIMHQLNNAVSSPARRRAHTTASFLPGRNPLMPTTNRTNNAPDSSGKKLPKTDDLREEEIREMVRVNQKLAREYFS